MVSLRTLLTGSILAIGALSSHIHKRDVNPGPVKGDTFIHDPTVVKKPDGTYLAAFTANGVGLKTSIDRTTWKDVGAAFPNGASWTTTYTKGDKNLWAPDLSYHNGQYYMYYSASSFGTSRSGIFLAVSKTGASGSWTNYGLVVESFDNSNYNAIDPNLYKSIASIAARPNNGGAIEAPFITKHGNYFYLWAAFDSCCKGTASTYRTMVGRSSKITGPYVDKSGKSMMEGGGTQILASHGNIHGPGHPAVFTDNDADVLVYHYYNAAGTAQLGINLIRYDNGWPTAY
ncbi:putative Arabinan endo-1,5-alpha-L-arabinosidase [Aureobasidium pullulans]|nr:putative Arabinan endo-1,5-alpha-L-arabinosidase [Aureobasidium pullulans]